MKKARMNISHFRFILFNLKIFGEIVTTLFKIIKKIKCLHNLTRRNRQRWARIKFNQKRNDFFQPLKAQRKIRNLLFLFSEVQCFFLKRNFQFS